jgi:acyl transferase domain-containing protein/NAD(P)-dependent dehydrogenase (short-subunit alcohol dehydrogenase family)/acyl carrier protein
MISTPIAIIGLSGRYPGGATSPARLWDVLRSGTDAVGEVPEGRWDAGYHNPDPDQPGRIYTRAGGFLNQIDTFDAAFFGMSPREARQVDPQHRLALELAWEALEDAALVPKHLAGSRTGVFIGISSQDYADLTGAGAPDAYTNIGSALAIAANRISYVLDLHGPSMSIDTACSSGLVGVHQACRSLIEGSSDIALAGAVNILAHAHPWIGFAKASMLSPTGRCHSFDAAGDGYVRAEGGGMVVLKPLAAAERDGDIIHGVILATGVNSDGHTMGLAMPNKHAQEALLRQVYGDCGVAPEDVFYVEAHGTGTTVGDPIECEAVGRVLGMPRQDGTRLHIGSVKSNIGHLEPASGIAGLTKVLLALRHREIPANLHFHTPNPKIDFAGWKLDVVDRAVPLPDRGKPLIFGINSFGFGGTNAHAVLAEYRRAVAPPAAAAAPETSLLLLSAQSEPALNAMARNYAIWLRDQPKTAWHSICATAALCRARLGYRLALTATGPAEAADALDAFIEGNPPTTMATGHPGTAPARTAFVYSGNGPQWWAMGRELLDASPVFHAAMAEVDALFTARAGWSLIAELRRPEAESRMALTEVAQPTLFALQLGLTAMLRAAGIVPDAAIGHSVGEVAAAYAAGALSLQQATDVIFHRSMMQARTAGAGQMAAIGIGPEAAEAALAAYDGALELAATNSPRAVTVAGSSEALLLLRDQLTQTGKFARILPLNYAFHSRAMDPVRDELLQRLADLSPSETTLPFISTVEGHSLPGMALDAAYWWRNVRAPVQFAGAIDHAAREHGITLFIEIGPHPVLRDYITQTTKAHDLPARAIATLRRPHADQPAAELEAMRQAICACHANGGGAPEALFTRPPVPAALPAYPWQRERHWRGAVPLADTPPPTERDHPLLGWRPRGTEALWHNVIDLALLPYLADHVVQGAVLFPAAGYIELALAAAARMFGEGPLELEGVEILRPLTVAGRPIPAVQCTVDQADGTWEIRCKPEIYAETATTHVRGRLTRAPGTPPPPADLASLRATLPDHVDRATHYQDAAKRGLTYGPAFQGVQAVQMSPAGTQPSAIADIDLPALAGAPLAAYRAHPALLDSCLQVLITLLGRGETRPCAFIPVQVERLRSYAPLSASLVCHITVTRHSARSGSAEIAVYDTEGALLLSLSGARFRKVDFRGSAGTLVTEAWRLDPSGAGRALVPVALPPPARIAATLAQALPALAEIHGRAAYFSSVAPRLNALIGAYAARALRELATGHASFTTSQLQRRGRVDPSQAPLLATLVAMAAEDGWLVGSGAAASWSWALDRTPPNPTPIWRNLLLDHPAYGAELVLAARLGETLTARLRGETLQGEPEPAAPFQALPAAIAAATLHALAEAWPAGHPIRVLELGGGSGSVTAELLPALPAGRTEYVFTDPSQASVDRAAQRFAAHPNLRTALFGTDPESAQPSLPPAGFDIVVAGEDLHAPGTLAQAYAMLVPGGWLLCLERSATRLETLLRGPAPAALPLRETGFTGVARIAAPAAPGHAPEQHVLLAQRPALADTAAAAPPPAEPRIWLLLAGPADTDFVASLAASLRARGQTVTTTAIGAAGGVPFATPEHMRALRQGGAAELVHLAGLLHPETGTPEDMLEFQDLRCLSALNLVQAVQFAGIGSPRLHLVTRGALAGPADTAPIDPAQAPLWGFGRVLANEYPDLAPHMVDLHAPLDAALADQLADELLRGDAEMEVLLTAGQRFVNRLQLNTLPQLAGQFPAPVPAQARAPANTAYQLDLAPQGGIDSLYLRATEIPTPAPGQVVLRVHAAGLNFRDVLWAMGMLPEEAVENGFAGATIGMECAGTITAIGEGVTSLAVGDQVVAFAASAFASHVATGAHAVARLPTGLGLTEAATIPTTFLTAYYGLSHLARLQPGETVLIHGAAGGVGLAALQIAKFFGATVFATAGSDEKRRVLRLLGADHVLNSRSLDFADDIMRLTGGRGIDVVLNSLAGEAITKNLQILRPFGRFLEIGKRDLYANSRIGLRPFRNNLSYFGIDADTLLTGRPDLARETFSQVMALFAAGALKPLPVTAMPVSRAAEAFRLMQQSRHIGKIVLTMPQAAASAAVPAPVKLRTDATYLVTGGLGGFGLATARWLVEQGVTSLALLSRRGATTAEASAGIAAMQAQGAQIRAFAADVTRPADIARVMADIAATMPPLRGVIHAAMVLDDAPIINLDPERMRHVLAPKLLGAWNLHQATRDIPLDHFILYSSGTTVVGNPGQANYVAANLYLESLAQYRRAAGLPALAIAWGAISDVGVLARQAGVQDMLQKRTGLGAIPAADALADLGRLLSVDATRVSVAQFNLARLGALLPGTRTPRFLPLAPQSLVASLTMASDTLADLIATTPAAERRAVVIARLRDQVGRVLGTGAGQVDPERSLQEMGLDSLMAVELAEALEQDIGQPMSVMHLIQAGAVAAIADLVLAALSGNAAAPAQLAAE